MNDGNQLLTHPPLLVSVEQRCQHEEYREGYVRGYAESATTLLNLCESVFGGTIGLEYVRERFAAKIEDRAVMLEEASVFTPNAC